MKFILQTKPTNCAPTALYNAMQWLGKDVEMDYLEYLTNFGVGDKIGVQDADIESAMLSLSSDFNFDCNYFASVFWCDLERKLDENTAFYLGYRNENNPKKKRNSLRHAVFLFTQGGKYYIVNDKKWTRPTLLLEADPEHLEAITSWGASGYFIRRNNDIAI